MCVEAAAEAVKLNCRILGVGEVLHYRSKNAPLCVHGQHVLTLDLGPGFHLLMPAGTGETRGWLCCSAGTVDFAQD